MDVDNAIGSVFSFRDVYEWDKKKVNENGYITKIYDNYFIKSRDYYKKDKLTAPHSELCMHTRCAGNKIMAFYCMGDKQTYAKGFINKNDELKLPATCRILWIDEKTDALSHTEGLESEVIPIDYLREMIKDGELKPIE